MTFFLDVDAMSASAFAPVVPDIIESRKREIQGLDEESHPNDIAGTYYGFRVLTEGSLHSLAYGFESSSLEAFDEVVKALGGKTRLKHTRFNYGHWRNLWHAYDKITHELLKAIMMVSAGGGRLQAGLRVIRRLGDSRALPTLHRLLESISVRSDRFHLLLEAIGSVGDPSSFDLILPFARKKKRGYGRKALAQTALIRCSRAVEHLTRVVAEGAEDQKETAARSLWMTFDSRALDALRRAADDLNDRVAG